MHATPRMPGVTVLLVTVLALWVAAPSLAATVSTRQPTPGITERTIWDETQVTIRELPSGVSHTGTIHMDLSFVPVTADLDLYILDGEGNVVSETGTLGLWPGREIAEYRVTEVVSGDVLAGDTYYVAVVAFNVAADYRIQGSYPRALYPWESRSPYFPSSYALFGYQRPADGTWAKITGPRAAAPYSFRPTSWGTGSLRLEWPADIHELVVRPDLSQGLMPAWVQQYLYGDPPPPSACIPRWDTEHVVVNDGTWAPAVQGDPADPLDDWYGIYDEFSTASWVPVDGLPHKLVRYVPSLRMAYGDPMLGPEGPPRTGRTTLGYRALLTYPENLWLKKVVEYDTYYQVYGTYSLNGERVPGATITIWRLASDGDYKLVTRVSTSDRGTWSVKLAPRTTWTIRAQAAGDLSAATGPYSEFSVTRVLKPL